MTESAHGPTPRWLRPVARPASLIFRCAVAWRNRRYDRESLRRLPIPVISVGNLSTGGTGKTPLVSFLARRLLEARRKPIIALRGYKARKSSPSDEATEHAQRLPDVCVVTGPNRYGTVSKHLKQHPDHDVVILDDGFQHRSLHRDFDLVLLDATRPPDRDALLPLGYLREPPTALARADAVILTRCELVDESLVNAVEDWLRHRLQVALVARTQSRWTHITSSEEPDKAQPVDMLSGRRVMLMCGLANPEAFEANAKSHGAQIVEKRFLTDHAHYSSRLLHQINDRAVHHGVDVLTSHKDWVKTAPLISDASMPSRFLIPQLDIEPGTDFDAVWNAIMAAIDGVRS